MKKMARHILLIFLLIFSFSAYGKQEDTDMHIRLSEAVFELRDDSLHIRFQIRTEGINLRTDQRLLLEFSLNLSDRRAVLPSVLYSGKVRARYDRRYRRISVAHALETPRYIYVGVDKKQAYHWEYEVSIPYGKWMDNAALHLRQVFESNGRVYVNDEVLCPDLELRQRWIKDY